MALGPSTGVPGRSASAGNLYVGTARYLSHDKKSAASAATTLAAVSGVMDVGGDALNEALGTTSSSISKGKARDPEELKATRDVSPKRPVSAGGSWSNFTFPRRPQALWLGAKSHLTLLLEKDRERSGEYKGHDETRKGKKR